MAEEDAVRPPPFRLLDENGHITTKAIELSGISQEEVENLGERLSLIKKASLKDYMERAIFQKNRSDSASGLSTFRIQASPDRGASLNEDIQKAISSAISSDKQKIISYAEDIGEMIDHNSKYDLEIEINKNSGAYFYNYIDAESGKTVEKGQSGMSNLKNQFGTDFGIGEYSVDPFAPQPVK